MKPIILCFFFACFVVSCAGDKTTNLQAEDVPDSTDVVMPEVEVAVEQSRAEIVNELEKNSTFFNLGCCKDMKKRKLEDCCCQEVLNRYKEIREKWTSAQIAEIKQKDPIFNDCRVLPSFLESLEALEKVPDAIELTPEDDPGAF